MLPRAGQRDRRGVWPFAAAAPGQQRKAVETSAGHARALTWPWWPVVHLAGCGAWAGTPHVAERTDLIWDSAAAVVACSNVVCCSVCVGVCV